MLCALVRLFMLDAAVFGKRLTLFTSDLCQTPDHMIMETKYRSARRTKEHSFFARIGHRLVRPLSDHAGEPQTGIRRTAGVKMLVSDISHQVKNAGKAIWKMATDTFLLDNL